MERCYQKLKNCGGMKGSFSPNVFLKLLEKTVPKERDMSSSCPRKLATVLAMDGSMNHPL